MAEHGVVYLCLGECDALEIHQAVHTAELQTIYLPDIPIKKGLNSGINPNSSP